MGSKTEQMGSKTERLGTKTEWFERQPEWLCVKQSNIYDKNTADWWKKHSKSECYRLVFEIKQR